MVAETEGQVQESKQVNEVNAGKDISTPFVPNRAHAIDTVLTQFLHAIDDYRDAVNVAVPLIAKRYADDVRKGLAALQKYEQKLHDGTDGYVATGVHAGKDLVEASRAYERLTNSRIVEATTRSLFIGMFSEYDGFIGSLLKAIYYSQPALFKNIKREINLSELLHFQSLDAVKADMLEKEIDAFRRQSYIEQFLEMERKFEIKTLRDFSEWPEFIEMSQRRNIMTHNSGRVSQQYMAVCEREGYKFDVRPQIGQEIRLDPGYMSRALLVITKVGFMLAHTLWRKLDEGTCDAADDAFNSAIFNLLKQQRWKTATELGQFGLTFLMSKKLNDVNRKIRIINTGIALKRQGLQKEVEALLKEEDWSACFREFKLANAILKDDKDLAYKTMVEIGKTGEMIREIDYHIWPLFDEVSVDLKFQETYEAIYSTPFIKKVAEEARSASEDGGRIVQVEVAAPDDGSITNGPIRKHPSKSYKKRMSTKRDGGKNL